MTEVTGDTLAVDLSTEFGGTYTYTAVHYDVNGNASIPATVTLSVAAGSDIVTLNAGWNLISTDRAVDARRSGGLCKPHARKLAIRDRI